MKYRTLVLASILAVAASNAQLFKSATFDFVVIPDPQLAGYKTLIECAAVMNHIAKQRNPLQPQFQKINAFKFNGTCYSGKTDTIFVPDGLAVLTSVYALAGQLATCKTQNIIPKDRTCFGNYG